MYREGRRTPKAKRHTSNRFVVTPASFSPSRELDFPGGEDWTALLASGLKSHETTSRKKKRRGVDLIIASVFVLLLFFVLPASGATLQSVEKGEVLWEDRYTDRLTDVLDHAQEEIFVLQYLVMGRGHVPRVQAILDSIKQRAQQGVEVTIIADGSREGDYGNPINAMLESYFGTAPVDVTVLPSDQVMHSKVVIVDRKHVFSGSQNWTKSGLTKNIELAVYLQSDTIASSIQETLLNSLDDYRSGTRIQPGEIPFQSVSRRELQSIPLIGPHYAKELTKYRDRRGRIYSVDQLSEVRGIGHERQKILHDYFPELDSPSDDSDRDFPATE